MSKRTGVHAAYRIPVEKLPSPNSYVAEVSADLRVFFPPNATRVQIERALDMVINRVREQLDDPSLVRS